MNDHVLYFHVHPERDIPLVRDALAAHWPCKGLTPLEVLALAADTPRFMVEPDPAVWPAGSNPLAVMRAQTDRPDFSRIRIVGENPNGERFDVRFENGRAVEVLTP